MSIDYRDMPPPDIPLYDLDEHQQRELEIYLKELRQRLIEYELDPRNFFRLAKPGGVR
jgi:hypothetical protein